MKTTNEIMIEVSSNENLIEILESIPKIHAEKKVKVGEQLKLEIDISHLIAAGVITSEMQYQQMRLAINEFLSDCTAYGSSERIESILELDNGKHLQVLVTTIDYGMPGLNHSINHGLDVKVQLISTIHEKR